MERREVTGQAVSMSEGRQENFTSSGVRYERKQSKFACLTVKTSQKLVGGGGGCGFVGGRKRRIVIGLCKEVESNKIEGRVVPNTRRKGLK